MKVRDKFACGQQRSVFKLIMSLLCVCSHTSRRVKFDAIVTNVYVPVESGFVPRTRAMDFVELLVTGQLNVVS